MLRLENIGTSSNKDLFVWEKETLIVEAQYRLFDHKLWCWISNVIGKAAEMCFAPSPLRRKNPHFADLVISARSKFDWSVTDLLLKLIQRSC